MREGFRNPKQIMYRISEGDKPLGVYPFEKCTGFRDFAGISGFLDFARDFGISFEISGFTKRISSSFFVTTSEFRLAA